MKNWTFTFLADVWDHFPKGFAMDAFWFSVCLLSLAVLILTVWSLADARWRRKPPLDAALRSQEKTLEDLKRSLEGLAPNEKVTELVNKLSKFATQEQIRAIELQIPEFITRTKLEACIEKLEREHYQQLQDLRAYVHEEVHKLRNDIGGMRLESTDAREGMHNRMHVFSEVLFEMRGSLQALKEALLK